MILFTLCSNALSSSLAKSIYFFSSIGYFSPNKNCLFNSRSPVIIHSVTIQFILKAGLLILQLYRKKMLVLVFTYY